PWSRPVAGDRHERPVQQHHGLAAPVNFVIHLKPVKRRVARRRFLLSRYDTGQERCHKHRQEKSRRLHVWIPIHNSSHCFVSFARNKVESSSSRFCNCPIVPSRKPSRSSFLNVPS